MWRRPLIWTCLLWFAVGFTLSAIASEDMVIHGGTIYTAYKTRPLAEELIAREGKLIYVDTSAVAKRVSYSEQHFKLRKSMVHM